MTIVVRADNCIKNKNQTIILVFLHLFLAFFVPLPRQ